MVGVETRSYAPGLGVYVRADPARSWELKNPRPNWRGLPLGRVEIGQLPNGRWIHGGGVCLPSGAGSGWPLGRWSTSNDTFASAAEAREAAFLRIVKRVDQALEREKICRDSRAVRAWALCLGEAGSQADLFS